VRAALQEVLEAGMTEAVGAEKGERTEAKQHCQNRRLPYLARRRIFTNHSGG
jgi:transposase-like protein